MTSPKSYIVLETCYLPGWGGWGEIENTAKFSPAEVGAWAELGNKLMKVLENVFKFAHNHQITCQLKLSLGRINIFLRIDFCCNL
jgi:hypothetical protein